MAVVTGDDTTSHAIPSTILVTGAIEFIDGHLFKSPVEAKNGRDYVLFDAKAMA